MCSCKFTRRSLELTFKGNEVARSQKLNLASGIMDSTRHLMVGMQPANASAWHLLVTHHNLITNNYMDHVKKLATASNLQTYVQM